MLMLLLLFLSTHLAVLAAVVFGSAGFSLLAQPNLWKKYGFVGGTISKAMIQD